MKQDGAITVHAGQVYMNLNISKAVSFNLQEVRMNLTLT